MNATTISLVVMYAMAAIIMLICILKDMHRSLLRGCVSLGLAALCIPLTILITHNTLDRVTVNLLHMVDLSSIAPLTRALPSLEESVIALVHMVVATEICRLVFFVLLAALTLIGHFVCVAIEKRKPALAKKSKPIGAAIGVAFGLVMIVAVLTPTAGYAAEAPEVVHILGEVEQITHEGEEAMSGEAVALQNNAQKVSDTFLLKMVRALGGKAIFRATTTVEIGGLKTDLYSEFHTLDAVGNKLALLTSVSIAEYGDEQYAAIKALANDIGASALLRTLSAEGLSSLSKAWLAGESFLGMEKPTDGGALDVALNVLLKRFENTTKDTVAEDVGKLSPAVASALKAYNTYNSMQSDTPNTSGTPGSSSGNSPSGSPSGTPAGTGSTTTSSTADAFKQVLGVLDEVVADKETRSLVVEIGAGIIVQELERFTVPAPTVEPSENESDAPPTEDAPVEDAPVEEPDDTESVIDLGAGLGSLVPWLSEEVIPAEQEVVVTEDELTDLVTDATDMAVSGMLDQPTEDIIDQLQSLCDSYGIDLSDGLYEELINGFLDSEYAGWFQ